MAEVRETSGVLMQGDASARNDGSATAGDLSAVGFRAMLAAAAVTPLPETGWIRVTGEDRVRWLNGMVTNSIQALEPGSGCLTFLLNAQGRIQGTATAFAEAEAILLETDRAQVAGMLAMLDRFVIMDDVELADVSEEAAGLEVSGPEATALLRTVGLEIPAGEPGYTIEMPQWQGVTVRVVRRPVKVVERIEVWAPAETTEGIDAALRQAGATAADAQAREWLRLMEGTPRFGMDIRERDLPQETGQTGEAGPNGALHFSKGCYLGQEIVERIRSRGQVHRVFGGFRLEGAAAAEPGAAMEAGGKAVGELTSVARLPAVPGYPEDLVLGLGYVRREALERGGEITCAGGIALPVRLPLPRVG